MCNFILLLLFYHLFFLLILSSVTLYPTWQLCIKTPGHTQTQNIVSTKPDSGFLQTHAGLHAHMWSEICICVITTISIADMCH